MRNFSFERLDYSSIKSVTTQKKCENYCQQGDAAGWKAQIFQKKCHILSFSTLTLQRAYTAIKPEFDCHFEEFWFREVLVCFSCCVFANKWNDTSQLNFGFFSQFSLFTARPWGTLNVVCLGLIWTNKSPKMYREIKKYESMIYYQCLSNGRGKWC